MRKVKKLLALIIAVVLAFSCFAAIPMTASALGGAEYANYDGGYRLKYDNVKENSNYSKVKREFMLNDGDYQLDIDGRAINGAKARVE